MRRLDKGVIGESKVLADLIKEGYEVFIPFSGYSPFDLISYKDNKMIRISVKYTSCRQNKSSW